jgi:hypothetical protein
VFLDTKAWLIGERERKRGKRVTEIEYVKAANLAHLRAAYAIIQQILPGYAVSDGDVRELLNKMDDAIDKAVKEVNLKEEV